MGVSGVRDPGFSEVANVVKVFFDLLIAAEAVFLPR
jgi:hypothetical protein